MQTYSPLVLVVDDDPACTRYLRRQFHNYTSVGVLVAEDLETGRALSSSFKIDALLTDLYFEGGKDSPARELYDGVDLAAEVRRLKPNIPTYVLSFMAEDPTFHKKAVEKGLSVARWLPKSFIGRSGGEQADAPWRTVEIDLMRSRLDDDPVAKEALERQADPEAILSLAVRLRRPVRTYIQALPDSGLKVTKAIEVICTLDEDLAKATAPALGLLNEGFGESVEEALDELAAEIQRQYRTLTQEGIETVDYADELRKRLHRFVMGVDDVGAA